MDVDDFLKNPEKVSHTVDFTTALIRNLEYSILNKIQLGAVIQNQVEIIELLKGSTGSELDDKVKEKIERTFDSIDAETKKEYYERLRDIIK